MGERTRRIMSEYIYKAWCPYRRYEVDAWWKHGKHMDIRIGLFIVSTDHVSIV